MKKHFIPFYFTDTTATSGLSAEMKTYYEKQLLEDASPELVHEQFGQKRPIPEGNGKTIEFRKYNPLGKALTPLTEGVTPNGQTVSVTAATATLAQYGGFVEISDLLQTTAFDPHIAECTKLIASQAGRTRDTVVREVINAGTNVQYADGSVDARYKLVGGEASGNKYLSVDVVRRAVRGLKKANAPKINGEYVAIVHPDAAYDLMSDSKWVNVHSYSDPENIYNGEIGKIEGVRFVESTEAKVFHAENLTAAARNLTVASVSTKTITVDEAISADEATALVGRKVLVGDVFTSITACASGVAGAATITVKDTPTGAADGTVVYPGEAGKKGVDIYSTLFIGADAYAVTDLEGKGLQHFVKQLGSSGTADPLNQRSTIGWKSDMTAKILQPLYMVRVETASTFEYGAN